MTMPLAWLVILISDKSEIIDYGDKKIDYSDLRTKKYFSEFS